MHSACVLIVSCVRSVLTATSDVKELTPEFYYMPEVGVLLFEA